MMCKIFSESIIHTQHLHIWSKFVSWYEQRNYMFIVFKFKIELYKIDTNEYIMKTHLLSIWQIRILDLTRGNIYSNKKK